MRLVNLHSTVKGTIVHDYAQGLWNWIENEVDYTNIKELAPLRLPISVESCHAQALQFYKEYNQTLEVLKDEFIVGSTEFDIAGSIDNLLIDKKTNDLILIDYKTNKKIDYNSFNGRRMLPPMDNLEDCNYIHYCLQLNIYKLLIEKYAAIPVKRIFLVYFDENKKEFEKIKILNLQKEALKLLQTRIC